MKYKRINGETTKHYIARVLKARRMLLGKGLAEAAEGCGITRQTARAIEDPNTPNTLNMVEAYLAKLGLEIELVDSASANAEEANGSSRL